MMETYYQVNPRLREEVILVGGPVHGRRTWLSSEQVKHGYEFVDAGAGGRNYGNEGPHGSWRSNVYKFFTKLGDVNLMVHGSVTEGQAWRLKDKLTETKEDLDAAREATEHVRRELSWEVKEKEALVARLEKTKKFTRLARELLDEAGDA
jgi:uncharacterized protein YfiM (DUF2279 family)